MHYIQDWLAAVISLNTLGFLRAESQLKTNDCAYKVTIFSGHKLWYFNKAV